MTSDATPSAPPDEDGPPVALADLLIWLGQGKRLIAVVTIVAAVASLAVSLSITPTFTARSTLLPPQAQQGGGSAAALAALGSLGALAGGLSTKTPDELYVALLRSERLRFRILRERQIAQATTCTREVDRQRAVDRIDRDGRGLRAGRHAARPRELAGVVTDPERPPRARRRLRRCGERHGQTDRGDRPLHDARSCSSARHEVDDRRDRSGRGVLRICGDGAAPEEVSLGRLLHRQARVDELHVARREDRDHRDRCGRRRADDRPHACRWWPARSVARGGSGSGDARCAAGRRTARRASSCSSRRPVHRASRALPARRPIRRPAGPAAAAAWNAP